MGMDFTKKDAKILKNSQNKRQHICRLLCDRRRKNVCLAVLLKCISKECIVSIIVQTPIPISHSREKKFLVSSIKVTCTVQNLSYLFNKVHIYTKSHIRNFSHFYFYHTLYFEQLILTRF